MKDLFEVEVVEIEGREELLVKKNNFFIARNASNATLVNTIREVKEEIDERGTL